jgi:hypothetical protein
MPKRKHHSINLLKNKDADFFGKFIKWTLTVGRLIVIVTEIIALSAFVYRFTLDKQLIDLRSEIKQKQTIVEGQRENEKKYRDLHDRILLASGFANLSQERHKILKDILGLTPQGITLNNLSLDNDKINIDTNVRATSSLGIFVNLLKNYPSIDSISIDNIENRPQENFIVVSMTATLKGSEFAIEEPDTTDENIISTVTPNPDITQ